MKAYPYKINEMTIEQAKNIATWQYDGIYRLYSGEGSEDAISEYLNGTYFSVMDESDALVGFFCYGQGAQVPTGNDYHAYDELNFLDVGLGMKPELCGQGRGYEFFQTGLEFGKERFNTDKFRLTVASFNERAIKLYENLGFVKTVVFDRNSNPGKVTFIVMEKKG